jgi:hypothetical protein
MAKKLLKKKVRKPRVKKTAAQIAKGKGINVNVYQKVVTVGRTRGTRAPAKQAIPRMTSLGAPVVNTTFSSVPNVINGPKLPLGDAVGLWGNPTEAEKFITDKMKTMMERNNKPNPKKEKREQKTEPESGSGSVTPKRGRKRVEDLTARGRKIHKGVSAADMRDFAKDHPDKFGPKPPDSTTFTDLVDQARRSNLTLTPIRKHLIERPKFVPRPPESPMPINLGLTPDFGLTPEQTARRKSQRERGSKAISAGLFQ